MTTIFLALLPVFIVILVGLGLRKTEVISTEQWAGLDHVCYFVLFPVIIFKEIAAADFAGMPVLQMAGAMAISVMVMIGLLVLLSRPLMAGLRINGPSFTSLVQGSARWHTFIERIADSLDDVARLHGFFVLRLGRLLGALQRFFDRLEIGERKLSVDRLDVGQRIDFA